MSYATISSNASTPTQTDRVYQQLRSDIIYCKLMPGVKLKINELCIAYGASLGTVREALAKLSAEHLVVPQSRRGYSVAPVSKSDLIDLTEARIEIESITLRRSIALGDIEWESRVISAMHVLLNLDLPKLADSDHEKNEHWRNAHNKFHNAIASACNSSRLLELRHMLDEQSSRYRRLSYVISYGNRDVNAEHKAIGEATLQRDADKAVKELTNHLRSTTEFILPTLEDVPSV
ncbi:GntR family transcriptional regulator [Halioxenophilus sp. WMMB6]|uniref:GntR family transcriptional regulator n=1 Tax=Halioxenophilus sp. WMMB6 TaxID=3073815 RepID=UPI00295F1545|nr:GntR family transcriptional regulator [Halioxenophilus sp. WMMB6]